MLSGALVPPTAASEHCRLGPSPPQGWTSSRQSHPLLHLPPMANAIRSPIYLPPLHLTTHCLTPRLQAQLLDEEKRKGLDYILGVAKGERCAALRCALCCTRRALRSAAMLRCACVPCCSYAPSARAPWRARGSRVAGEGGARWRRLVKALGPCAPLLPSLLVVLRSSPTPTSAPLPPSTNVPLLRCAFLPCPQRR